MKRAIDGYRETKENDVAGLQNIKKFHVEQSFGQLAQNSITFNDEEEEKEVEIEEMERYEEKDFCGS